MAATFNCLYKVTKYNKKSKPGLVLVIKKYK